MDVRVATRAEIVALDRLFCDPHAPASRHQTRWELQQQGDGLYFVASAGEEPIGWVFLAWTASPQAGRGRLAEMIDLSVAEPARRGGAGRALVLAAVAAAREAGMEGIGLKVTVSNPWNEAARVLYESEGFVDSGAGEFDDGYWYWTPDGEKHWDGEPHRYLVKRF